MKKLAAVSSLVLFLAACGVNDDGTPRTNTPPTVTLAASPGGAAPLTVALNATASDPDGDALSYAWSLPGLPDSATVQTTFAAPGEYPVSVTVSDGEDSATASVTVSVTGDEGEEPVAPGEPENPVSPPTDPGSNPDSAPPTGPEPTEPTIKLTATPGGPAPWSIRYDVTASGFPEDSTLQTVCRVRIDPGTEQKIFIVDNKIDEDSFACFYPGPYAAGSGFVRVVSESGATLDEVALTPRIAENNDPLYFSGSWRYTYREANTVTDTGTFTIVKPFANGGSSEDDSFAILLEELNDEALPYFEDRRTGGTGGFLEPNPLQNGAQRYTFADSVGLSVVLEKLD